MRRMLERESVRHLPPCSNTIQTERSDEAAQEESEGSVVSEEINPEEPVPEWATNVPTSLKNMLQVEAERVKQGRRSPPLLKNFPLRDLAEYLHYRPGSQKKYLT